MPIVFSASSIGFVVFGSVSFWGNFLISVVFPFVVRSGMSDSCRHLFLSIASLSWICINLLNHYLCMPSGPGVFQFVSFWVLLSESRCIFTIGPPLSPNSFPTLLIHSAFLLCSLRSYIFLQNCFVSLSSSWWYAFVQSAPYFLVELFSLFWNILFYLYCLILSRYLFSLPSFVSTFWFISSSCIVCFTCWIAFFFSSQHVPAFFSFFYHVCLLS